ncbi:MAG: sensor histidine kinase [Chloroflexota bacterium]|nr:sensor histidine kinase [Chloroflexota bacterium]
MERERGARGRLGLPPLDLILLLLGAGLGLITLAFALDATFSFALVDRSLDVTINSLTMLAALSLAAMALARYRESGRVAGLFQSSALLVLAWLSGLNTVLVLLKVDGRAGLTLGNQPAEMQLPLYVWSLAAIVAASLFAIGGLTALTGATTSPASVRRTLLVPLLIMSALTAALYVLGGYLPPLVGEEGLQLLIATPSMPGILPTVSPLALLLSGFAIALFLLGVYAYRHSYLRNGPVADGYLAVALLLAAFAQLHLALYPAVATGLVTTADALRVAFILVLLLGISGELRSDLRALRSAYAALERLRETEAERATLEERTRLARELHDGLAQDLWFAKLKHERLTPLVPAEARGLAAEVTQALDTAIAEAKQAVVTMRAGLDQDQPLQELLAGTVEDFGNRSGLRADFWGADLPTALSPRKQAEVLRIVQEALTNVRKHADATVGRVSAEVSDGRLLVGIADNGRGFRADETSGNGLGLQGMKERARLMGGELRVLSEPSGGTTIRLAVPIADPRR